MRSTKNTDLLISAAQVDLFARMSAFGDFYTAGETPALPGWRACCKLLVSIKNVLLGRLASSPPADYKSALPAPAECKSALRRSQASLLKVLTSTLSHLNTLILFAMNLKLHTTAFASMRFCYCFYLIFTTAVDLFVFAQILLRPNTFTQRRRAHQLRSRSGINRLLLTCSLQRHQ